VTVNGSKFVKGAQVVWNSTTLTTTFISATKITAAGTAVRADVGKVSDHGQNPDPGTVASKTAYTLTVSPPAQCSGEVAPTTAQIRASAKQQNSRQLSRDFQHAVTWSVNSVAEELTLGMVDASGMYTAPTSLPNPKSGDVRRPALRIAERCIGGGNHLKSGPDSDSAGTAKLST